MTHTEDSRSLEAERSTLTKQPISSIRFDRVMVALSGWLIGGLYLDGWAHNQVPELETFFTPWHALWIMFSGSDAYRRC